MPRYSVLSNVSHACEKIFELNVGVRITYTLDFDTVKDTGNIFLLYQKIKCVDCALADISYTCKKSSQKRD